MYQDDVEIATPDGPFRSLLFRLTADGKISYTYSVYLDSSQCDRWYELGSDSEELWWMKTRETGQFGGRMFVNYKEAVQ